MTTRFALDRANGFTRFSSGGGKGLDEFKESEHPRAANGEFGQGSGSASAAPAPAPAAAAAPAPVHAPAAAPAHEAPSATTMVSPNVGSNYTVGQGARRLHSAEQSNYMAVSKKVDSMLGLNASERPAIGAWSDGGENSVVTTYSKSDSYEAVKAAVAMKGLLAQQKGVITFQAGEGGSTMHTMTGLRAMNPEKLSAALVAAGIPYHTLVKKDRGYDVHVFNPEASPEADHNITKLAKVLGGTSHKENGSGEMMGSWDSRSEGRAEYEKVIKSYTDSHPEVAAKWNEMLGSHKFRKAEDNALFGGSIFAYFNADSTTH